MIDAFLGQPAVILLVVVLVLSLLALFAGYKFASRKAAGAAGRDENAFGLGQTAIFGLIVLILAFSFSFAAERFEARRAQSARNGKLRGLAVLSLKRAAVLPDVPACCTTSVLVPSVTCWPTA